jgi:methionine sulfoxide reductase heme-binding subunit
MTDVTPHLLWITSRAAGTAALLLASLGVCVGLLMGGRFVRGRGLDLRAAHETISIATIVAIVVHAVALLGDQFLHPSVADITLPFVSGYKTVWTTIGIVAGWSTIALGLSFYARGWIGQRRWRSLHRFTVLAWSLGVIHSLGEGTDAGQAWFLAMTTIAVVPALVLFVARVSGVARPPARSPAAFSSSSRRADQGAGSTSAEPPTVARPVLRP